MRLYKKVSCIRCSEYEHCRMETRLYVNYCGSMSERISKQIEKALAECRSRRGLCIKRGTVQVSDAKIRAGIHLIL